MNYNIFKGDSNVKASMRNPLLILISIITVLSLVFSVTVPAYAQKENPGKGGESKGQGQDKALLKLFERLQAWQKRQLHQFDQADLLGDQLQLYIDRVNSGGQDIEKLQAELNYFKSQVKEARKPLQLAQLTIATHYGIDEKGEIYSVKSTRQTIKVASQSLAKAHRLLSDAVKDMQQDWRDWQSANEQGLVSQVQLE